MEPFLLRIETYGTKNIKEKISLDFYQQTIVKEMKNDKSKVKAIYGANGAGKSAIINAVDLYKKINSSKDYLTQINSVRNLKNIINKITKEFYFKVIFALEENKEIENVFSHEILLAFEDEKFVLKKEKLERLNDKTINGDYLLIYEIEDGKFVNSIEDDSELFTLLKDKSKNLLKHAGFVNFLADKEVLEFIGNAANETPDIKTEEYSKILDNLAPVLFFVGNLSTQLELEDEFDINFARQLDRIVHYLKKGSNLVDDDFYVSYIKDRVKIEKYKEYEDKIGKLFKFLKIFKPDLQGVKIDRKIDNEYYVCSKILNYGDYEVDSEYESTGIKKLMKLYSCLEKAANGDIVFIDELDANLNGVYLEKLVEYFLEYGKGQLCFTTHNMEPMKRLSKESYSLDFLGETGQLVSWVKNGNYSARNQYKEGMIKDSPFNVSTSDFLSAFYRGE